MRILQVSSANDRGGGETHVLELTAALRKRGHEVLVAGRINSPVNPDIQFPFRNSADLFTAIRLRSILKKDRFDVLHAHVARDYTIAAAAAWGISGVKVIFTRHLLFPIRRHFLYGRVDGWIAPTSQILKTLEPLSPKNSAVIPNWVDVERFNWMPHALHDPVSIGLLGQISPHKGHGAAIDAMRQLGSGYRLIIAGKGDADYTAELKQKASGLAVEFPGFVSVPEFFEKTDILIVPSWDEPFGIVLLEAMASGVPVIATNRGGPAEIISSPEHGVLIPPHDPKALAEAISLLASDETRRTSIVRNARHQVDEKFDARKIIPHIERFYGSARV